MSETKYKLCKRAGLKVTEGHGFYDPQGPFAWIAAADVEKLLEGAPVVRARLYDNEVFGEWFDKAHEQDTHTARLLLIEPIVKDTAESLLKELIEADMTPPANEFPKKLYDILERAKRILEVK